MGGVVAVFPRPAGKQSSVYDFQYSIANTTIYAGKYEGEKRRLWDDREEHRKVKEENLQPPLWLPLNVVNRSQNRII